MPTITLSVPSDLKKEMDKSKFINWSEVAREAIRERVAQLAVLNAITSKSKLTEKDALEIGRKIKKSMHERFKKEHPGAFWMDLIIDAKNIVMSALISMNGKTRDLIFLSNLSLFAPEYLMEEIEKHKTEIIKKSDLDGESFEIAKSLILSKIKLIPFSEFESSINKAKAVCPDPNDTEYFALALSKNIPIWSDDKALKQQSGIKIYSTSELLKEFNIRM